MDLPLHYEEFECVLLKNSFGCKILWFRIKFLVILGDVLRR